MISWPARGRRWLLVAQVACLGAIVLAGRASAERPAADDQGTWLAVAIAAAVLSAAGNGVWLSVVRRAGNRRRQLVLARLADRAATAITAPTATAVSAGEAVMVPGLTLRHRPGCELVAGRTVVPASPDTSPCGWCWSDQGRSDRERA